MVANFRSYEGQLRLLTSVIAAHPELRLNYKEMAKHFGSDWTESGIEHFMRPIKKNAKEIQAMVRRDEDPLGFNHNVGKGSAASAVPATPTSSVVKTPRNSGSRKRTAPSTGKSTASKKLKESGVKFPYNPVEDPGDDSDNEFSPLNLTPTKNGISIDHEKMAAHERAMGISYANETPSLQSAQATTPDDVDGLWVVNSTSAVPASSFKKLPTETSPSGVKDVSTNWDHDPFPAGDFCFSEPAQKGYVDEEFDGEC